MSINSITHVYFSSCFIIVLAMCFKLSFAVPTGQNVDKQKVQVTKVLHQNFPEPAHALLQSNNYYTGSRYVYYDGGQVETVFPKRSKLLINDERLQLKGKKSIFQSKLVKRNIKQDFKYQKVDRVTRKKRSNSFEQGENMELDETTDDKLKTSNIYEAHFKKTSYKTWDEYLQNQKSFINQTLANSKSLIAEGSFISSDSHFRLMDKMFKEKNDRVKTFHALVLFMKELGKEFKIPQTPTNDS